MATISEALTIAVEHHQAGRLEQAEQIYRQILAAEPDQADALHLLGVIAHQSGRHAIAVDYIRRAIGREGGRAIFHNSLGEAYRALRQFPEGGGLLPPSAWGSTRTTLRHTTTWAMRLRIRESWPRPSPPMAALERKPDYVEMLDNLGTALFDQQKLSEAVTCYRRALQLRPDFAEAHNNLGVACTKQGNLDEASACLHRAVELKPDYPQRTTTSEMSCGSKGSWTGPSPPISGPWN